MDLSVYKMHLMPLKLKHFGVVVTKIRVKREYWIGTHIGRNIRGTYHTITYYYINILLHITTAIKIYIFLIIFRKLFLFLVLKIYFDFYHNYYVLKQINDLVTHESEAAKIESNFAITKMKNRSCDQWSRHINYYIIKKMYY